ncbi:hypothetical protein ACFQ7A_03440 [Streptomyces sp. NPDC056528]|uniref:hypothetical protein n=1 Tax=Streptomyces sp. NPDC056528 TaxID=3345854 RepID=UPI0036C00EA0
MTKSSAPTGQNKLYEYSRCAFALCGRRFRRLKGPGRPRRYCQDACRRRAQRVRSNRQTQQALPAPTTQQGHRAAQHLQTLAGQLVQAEQQGASLEELAGHALALNTQISQYLAATVRDARGKGLTCRETARQARLSEETVRALWTPCTPPRPAHICSRQAQDADLPRDQAGSATATQGRHLGAAISCLLRTRGVTAQEAAHKTGLSHACVLRLASGHRVPDWPVVFSVVTAAGGLPGEFRYLWEQARSIPHTSQHSAAASLTRFRNALRGLQWASGSLPHSTDNVLTAVLNGHLVPDWAMTQRIVQAFSGEPGGVKELWEDVRHSLLSAGALLSPSEVPDADDPT